eukprot:CAMPEP_0117665230 /NCGR_PEP_ID=MMETSP0804-20121206/9694_1 /TAXON_ID=1074897 /ORGANISM="Tetraselmis astigmatica, Strain CCMP880" /LENGTH=545 /DNA_ID=CAMNT_0005472619 /DNA_START=662 /DNA_END=2297 /DNA_ORIENTATION=+
MRWFILLTVLLWSSSALKIPLPSWFGSHSAPLEEQAEHDPAAESHPEQETDPLNQSQHPLVPSLRNLPTMPHPHPITSRGTPRVDMSIKRKQSTEPRYVCKSKHAGDLLARAIERIGGSLFLNQERLDHFNAANKFNEVFASKYLPKNWESFVASRGLEMYDRCAVVGNSGHLTLSRFGRAIDSFDAVIRTNQAPTQNYTHLVGEKTTFRLINRAMARRYLEAMESRYRRLKSAKSSIDEALEKIAAKEAQQAKRWERSNRAGKKNRLPPVPSQRRIRLSGTLSKLAESLALKRLGVTEEMLWMLRNEKDVIERLQSIMSGVGDDNMKVNRERFPLERNVSVVLVTEVTSTREEMESFIRAARQLRPDVKAVIQSGKARKVIEEMLFVWSKRLKACYGIDTANAGGSRATTGILATIVMLKQCQSVTLYGFGPPAKGPNSAPFHFYDGYLHRTYESASKSVHNFSAEYRFLMKLREEKLLQMCNELDDNTCGMADASGKGGGALQGADGDGSSQREPAAGEEEEGEQEAAGADEELSATKGSGEA